jgi:hypothetical protein
MDSLIFGYEVKHTLRAIIVYKVSRPKDGVKIRRFEYGCANITRNVYFEENRQSVVVCSLGHCVALKKLAPPAIPPPF